MAVNGVTAADFISLRISWTSGPSGVDGGGLLKFNFGGWGRALFIGGRCCLCDDEEAEEDDDDDDEEEEEEEEDDDDDEEAPLM